MHHSEHKASYVACYVPHMGRQQRKTLSLTFQLTFFIRLNTLQKAFWVVLLCHGHAQLIMSTGLTAHIQDPGLIKSSSFPARPLLHCGQVDCPLGSRPGSGLTTLAVFFSELSETASFTYKILIRVSTAKHNN